MDNKYKISIDELCEYSYQFASYVENVVEHNKNNPITDNQYDKLLSKISMMYSYRVNNIGKLLLDIVKIKLPNEKQVTKLIKAITLKNKIELNKNKIEFKWVNHIRSNGVVLTKKHLASLLDVGYINFDCPELKSKDDKIKKTYLLSLLSELKYEKLMYMINADKNVDTYCGLKKIIKFDNDYFDLFHNALVTHLKLFNVRRYYNMEYVLREFLKTILDAGYYYDHHGLKSLINNRVNGSLSRGEYSEIIKKFIEHNIYPSGELLFNFLDTGETLCESQLEIVESLLEKGLNIDSNILNIMHVSLHKDKIKYGETCNNIYINIFNKLKYNFVPTYETMLFSCKTCNFILLDFCVEKNIEPDMECMYAACRGYNSVNILKLMDMKLTIDDRCLKECLSQKSPSSEIIYTIVNSGIDIPDSDLEYLMLNNVSIPEKCTVSEKMKFKICHRYDLPMTKWLSATFMKSKEYKLYKMVNNKTNKSTFYSTEAYMKKEKIEFSQECYDEMLIRYHRIALFDTRCHIVESVIKYNDVLCDAIKEGKYVVTTEAIARCNDNLHRMKLMKHYGFLRD